MSPYFTKYIFFLVFVLFFQIANSPSPPPLFWDVMSGMHGFQGFVFFPFLLLWNFILSCFFHQSGLQDIFFQCVLFFCMQIHILLYCLPEMHAPPEPQAHTWLMRKINPFCSAPVYPHINILLYWFLIHRIYLPEWDARTPRQGVGLLCVFRGT